MIWNHAFAICAMIPLVCQAGASQAMTVPPPDIKLITEAPRVFCTIKYGTSLSNGVLINESEWPVFSNTNAGVCAVYCGSCKAALHVRTGERSIRYGDDLFRGACLEDKARVEKAGSIRSECGL